MKIKSRLRSSLPRAARVAAPAVVGLSLLGFAVPAASADGSTYTATAKSSGLVINLFGTQLTGGTALATVDSANQKAFAEGVGTLTPGMVEDQKVSADSATPTPQALGKACAQGGGAPSSSPIGIDLGLACSSAAASITGFGPSAAATGEVAGLDVNLSSVLDQVLSGGADQLFSGLQQILGQINGSPLGTGSTACPDPALGSTSSAAADHSSSTNSSTGSSTGSPSPSVPLPNQLTSLADTASVPGSPLNTLLGSLGLGSSTAASTPGPLGNLLQGLCQTLTNIETVVKNHTTNTLVVDIGPASASVIPAADKSGDATATADGATAEVQILPGVGCAATLAECIADPSGDAVPLIDIKIAPAHASSVWDGSKWTPSTKGSLATVDLNIPGFAQAIDIPGGQSQTLLAGTPLETVIDLGSASTDTTGQGGTANGATLDVAKNTNGGILLDLGSSSVSPTATPPKTVSTNSPQAVPPVVAASHSPAAAPPAMAPISGPTLVHTGAWWSGSLPYLAGVAALGGGLLGWPRLRRGGKGLGTLLRAARR